MHRDRDAIKIHRARFVVQRHQLGSLEVPSEYQHILLNSDLANICLKCLRND